MASPKEPENSTANFKGDWFERMMVARETYGDQWQAQFTPEELRVIEEACDAECKWVSHANEHDLPGPRRFGVIED
jgi:hypothetical protein